MNPLDLDISLRELVWMVEGYQEAQWNHTSSLRALLAPLAAFVCKDPLDPADFHPMRKQKPRKRQSIAEIREEKVNQLSLKKRGG